ncbi:MAG TPA: hypothetical protein VHW96_05615 [Solirubrobacteraceae bacterium]|nr:hypothetical protein [Solirubrobacteraceae bacterium]
MRDGLASGPWRVGLAAAVGLACLVGAGPASAHLRSGTVAVDYRASVSHPVTRAYSAQIYQSDHGLSLTVRPGHVVVVLGYLQEPVIRLDGAGLSVNAASPTARAMHLVDKAHAVEAAGPRWRLQRGRRSVVWHDARVQGLPAGLTEGVWRVPLVIDGRSGLLSGELRRSPDPPLSLWLAALAGWLAAASVPLIRRRRHLARTWAMALAVIATGAATAVALAFALDAYASPGTWIVGVDVIIFLAVGMWVMRRGPRHLHVAAAMWAGLVSLALGLLDGSVFLHPIVLAVLPGTVMRLLVVTAIGAGASAAGLGSTLFSEIASVAAAADSVSS